MTKDMLYFDYSIPKHRRILRDILQKRLVINWWELQEELTEIPRGVLCLIETTPLKMKIIKMAVLKNIGGDIGEMTIRVSENDTKAEIIKD